MTAQYLQDTFYLYLLWVSVMCVDVSIQVCGHMRLCTGIHVEGEVGTRVCARVSCGGRGRWSVPFLITRHLMY